MLNFQMVNGTMFQASTELFTYKIEPIDGQFYWSLWIGKTLKQDRDRIGPFSLHEAKENAQADYTAKLAHGKKVIENGGYVQAD